MTLTFVVFVICGHMTRVIGVKKDKACAVRERDRERGGWGRKAEVNKIKLHQVTLFVSFDK